MGITQAQGILQNLQQQMSSPGYAQQFMNQLGQAGLGAQNPQQFFGTPFDEQVLRQGVLGRMMGYFGMPGASSGMYGGVGSPFALFGGMPTDPYSGGMQQMPEWMRGGFDDKGEWKRAGRPESPSGMMGFPGGRMQILPADLAMPEGGQFGGTGGGFMAPPNVAQGGTSQFNDPFYQMMGGYNPQVSALNQNYPGMFAGALERAMSNYGGGGGATGGPYYPPGFGAGAFPGGLPSQANTWLDQLTKGQIGQMDLDYQQQKQQLIDQMFGTGMNQSSAAADAAGKLLYGRSQALNQITGMGADRALQLYQTMLENQKGGAGGGGINYFGGGGFGGGGGGLIQNLGQELGMMGRPEFGGNTAAASGNYGMGVQGGVMQSPQNAMNYLQAAMGGAGNSPIPMTFEQQMQLAQMQLAQQQLQQSGMLGFGGLGLQRELGLGSQGLQERGLSQDFMQFLLNQGLQRQQGAAGFNQSDLSRMQNYLTNQSGLMAGIGQQNAQLEAQKQSFWKQLALAGIGGASALFGGMASGGTGFFRP